MAQLVLQIAPDIAPDLHQRGTGQAPDAQGIVRAVESAGGTVSPMHPGTSDPALAGYFLANLSDREAAAALAERLLSLPSVEAAYVKPDDAPPGG